MQRFAGLEGVSGLRHAVTTRTGGVSEGPYATLNLGLGTDDARAAVEENRRRVAAALGLAGPVFPHQVHGAAIRRIRDPGDVPGACDGLSTDRPGVLLGVLGADCPGVLLVAPAERVLAVVHAGWRGIAADVVGAAVAHLRTEYGVAAASLRAAIGPGISADRYEVSSAVADEIRAALPAASVICAGRPGHAQVDLVGAIRAQLVARGIPRRDVEHHGACTAEDERFFSHRRDAGVTGRHALLAGWDG